jgi:hypothetical protein
MNHRLDRILTESQMLSSTLTCMDILRIVARIPTLARNGICPERRNKCAMDFAAHRCIRG